MRIKGFLLALVIFAFNFCDAQFYKSVLPSPEFSNALEKIVLDFRLNFKTIQGDSLSKETGVDIYASTVKLPGASECVIYHYHSLLDTTASWQALMYRGEDYKEAARTYQNVFRMVKKSQVKWIDKSLVGFSGEMQQPKDDLRFAASTLKFDLEDRRYKHFQATVEMVSTYSGWEVHLNLETKKPDEEGSTGY